MFAVSCHFASKCKFFGSIFRGRWRAQVDRYSKQTPGSSGTFTISTVDESLARSGCLGRGFTRRVRERVPGDMKGRLFVRASEIAEGFRRASYNAEIVRKLIRNLFMDTTGDSANGEFAYREHGISLILHDDG